MKKSINFLVFFSIFGCSGDNTTTGNPLVALSIQGTEPGSLNTLSTSGFVSSKALVVQEVNIDVTDTSSLTVGGFKITSAKVALKEIEFEMAEGNGQEAEIDFKGPFVVDLLNNSITPAPASKSLPEGVYNEIKLKIDKVEGDELDEDGVAIVGPADPLFGKSILISGLYTGPTSNAGNVVDTPFQMTFDLEESLELSGAHQSVGFSLNKENNKPVIIAFRMSKWMFFGNIETNPSGTEPALLEVVGGEINLSKNSLGNNLLLREVVRKNILSSIDFGKDKDGNGHLDKDEDDDPDTEDADDD